MAEPWTEAPMHSRVMAIEDGWIDYNGHLNMAYYNVLFDRAVDEALIPIGLGPDYTRQRGATFMNVETHICYLRELFRGHSVRVASRVLDVDEKRLHLYFELRHAQQRWLAATSESMFLHVDLGARKSAPWPAEVRDKLEAMKTASAKLPRPERAGRRIGLAPRARRQAGA